MRLLGTPPPNYNLRLLKEQARTLDKYKGLGEQADGRIVFGFSEGSEATQSDVDALLAAHNGTQLSQNEIDKDAVNTRRAALLNRIAVLEAGTASPEQVQQHLADITLHILNQ